MVLCSIGRLLVADPPLVGVRRGQCRTNPWGMRVRTDDMVRLGVACAELAVRGENYRQPLADGMLRVLDVDAGIGVVQWDLNDQVTADSLVTVAGTPRLTTDAATAVLSVVPDHPLLSRPDFPVSRACRISDLTCLAAFWDQPAWRLVHGINEGRYPAMVSLGWHLDRTVFVGAQRRRQDFSDEDMEVLDAVREPLTSALAFRSELDRATRRLRGLRVVDDPVRHRDQRYQDPRRDRMDATRTETHQIGTVAGRLASVHLLPPCGSAAVTAAPLTRRESEVLALVAGGWTSHRVGRALGISERTVRKHLGNVYDKLGVSGRTSAATWWVSRQ